MVQGGGIGGLVMAALPLIGMVSILRARARRRAGEEAPDQEAEDRRAATAEAERRMASYLASRDQRSWTDSGE